MQEQAFFATIVSMRAGHHARFLLFRSVVLFLLLAAGGVVPVAADVVVLKSGRRIQAVNVEERDGKVYYEIEYRKTDPIEMMLDNDLTVYRLSPSGYRVDMSTGKVETLRVEPKL
ncbi:MAG: hypothetical protein IH793_10830 [Acidobacteria bacterium]|nr:hypothetical protein [Acidobacteriota bacterium]